MNYHKHYDRLIDRARNRVLSGYSEKHHANPKCLGGDNSPENIVRLTPEEHYVAHQFLVKMYPGDHRLLWAAVCMTNGTKKMPGRQNKLYGWLRRKFANELGQRFKGRFVSEETRAKQSASRRGKKRKPHSEETKAKMSAASKGRPKSEEHRAALSAAKLGSTPPPHSRETIAKITRSNRLRAADGWNAKLTTEQVDEIRRLGGTMVQREIAERFGVTAGHISEILAGKKRAES